MSTTKKIVKGAAIGSCRWCSTPDRLVFHEGRCPEVVAMGFNKNGTVRWVRFRREMKPRHNAIAEFENMDDLIADLAGRLMDEDDRHHDNSVRLLAQQFVHIMGADGIRELAESFPKISTDPTAYGMGLTDFLRHLGDIDDPETHEARRLLLEGALAHTSYYARDGAVLGLANMDDPKALPALREALEAETSADFRPSLEQVIEQLEHAQTPLADNG